MLSADAGNPAVKARAVLVDPASMAVVWMNEAAAESLAPAQAGEPSEVTIDRLLPMAGAMGVPQALREVAETGVPRHVQTGLVTTSKGSVALVTSIYRLPDGHLLVLTENAWQPGHERVGRGPTRPGRRTR